MKKLIEAYQAAILAITKRVTLTDARHELAKAEREGAMLSTCYGSDTKTKAAFVEYCASQITKLVEASHGAALKMEAERTDYLETFNAPDVNAMIAEYPELVKEFYMVMPLTHVHAAREMGRQFDEALDMDAERNLQAYDKWAAETDDEEETDTQPLRALAQFMQAGANKETFNYYVSRHGSVRAFECWQEDVRRLHAEHERAMSLRETFQTFAGRRG